MFTSNKKSMHVLLPLLPLCTMARKRPSRSHPSKRKPPPKSPPKTEAKKRPATDAASSSAPKQKKSSVLVLPTPDKAPVDTNKYKLIQLPNGIRALLVHKPPTSENPPFCPRRSRRVGNCRTHLQTISSNYSTNSKQIKEGTGSICVVVRVGTTADKDYRPGLAHFTEHMVHYGSQKFMEEDGYLNFALNTSTEFNAITSEMTTTYYISVPGSHLEEGCRRMSDMLTNPLLTSSMIKREVHAVDNEYYLGFHAVSNAYLLVRNFVKKDHPIEKFTCGNLETLLPDDNPEAVNRLRDELVQFHSKNYVGTGMTLAIQSPLSLPCLEKLILKNFQAIPRGESCLRREIKVPDCHKNPYQTKEFNRLYFVEGKEPTPYLTLTWALPPEVWQDYQRKPMDFWASLIADEREVGVAHRLRREGFISDIAADTSDNNDYTRNEYCTMFEVNVALSTPWFFDNKDTLTEKITILLENLFRHLGRLRNLPHHQKSTLWSDFTSKNLSFSYSIPSEGGEFTQQCATALQIYPEKEIFTSARVTTEYQDEIMTGYLALLTTTNINVMAIVPGKVLQKYSNDLKLTGEGFDKFTETKFWSRAFPKSLLTRLNKLLKEESSCPLVFPRNPFHFDLGGRPCVHRVPPTVLQSNDKCRVEHNGNAGADWYLAECVVEVHSSAVHSLYHHENLYKLVIMCGCLTRAVLPITSPAESCGLQFSIALSSGSLKLQFIGFPESLAHFIDQIMECVFPPEGVEGFPRYLFEVVKEDVINNVRICLGDGSKLISSLFEEILIMGCPSFRTLIATLRNISYEDFILFIRMHAKSSFIHARTVGNVPLETCERIAVIINRLNYYPRIDGWEKSLESIKPEAVKMFPFDPRCIRVKSECRIDKNSVISNFYQVMPCASLKCEEVIDYLVLAMRAPFFKILRMGLQLGYRLNINYGQLTSPFIMASVTFPAHKKTLCEVDSAIDAFFVKYYERYLSCLTESEFEEQKQMWSISDDVTIQRVQDFYERTFLRHIQPRGLRDDGPLGWTHEAGKIRKISIQVLGKCSEKCKNTYARCNTSRWTKPPKERNQPISFSADEYDTTFPYFINDPQLFRDGR